jgi:hypothetical protein
MILFSLQDVVNSNIEIRVLDLVDHDIKLLA